MLILKFETQLTQGQIIRSMPTDAITHARTRNLHKITATGLLLRQALLKRT